MDLGGREVRRRKRLRVVLISGWDTLVSDLMSSSEDSAFPRLSREHWWCWADKRHDQTCTLQILLWLECLSCEKIQKMGEPRTPRGPASIPSLTFSLGTWRQCWEPRHGQKPGCMRLSRGGKHAVPREWLLICSGQSSPCGNMSSRSPALIP